MRHPWVSLLRTSALVLCVATWVSETHAQDLERVNVSTAGVQAVGADFIPLAQDLNSSGRYVIFWSSASTLVLGDANGARDVFLRDRQIGTTVIVSLSSGNVQGNDDSGFGGGAGQGNIDVTANGRFVVFESAATNLVAGDVNNLVDVFLRDRTLNVTERISGALGGSSPSISDDGGYVAFSRGNGFYLHDRIAGTTDHFATTTGQRLMGEISANGRYVAFGTGTSLVPADVDDGFDIYLYDRIEDDFELISVSNAGVVGNGNSVGPRMTPDARYVVFSSKATNLVVDDDNDSRDVFVRDRLLGTSERISLSIEGAEANGDSFNTLDISDNGRYVSFSSEADNLAPDDVDGFRNPFVKDRVTGELHKLDVPYAGGQPTGGSISTRLSGNGRVAAFDSGADNLVPGDTNEESDLFAAEIPVYPFEYVAKVVCGVQRQPGNLNLTPGYYATTVNVHNPGGPVTFVKKLALTHPPAEQAPGEIHHIAQHKMAYDQALAIDGNNLLAEAFGGVLPDTYFEGFVVIQSSASLDVTAVYTSSALGPGGTAGTHSSIHVETIRERDRGLDLEVDKAVQAVIALPFGDFYTLNFILYSVEVTNNGSADASDVRLFDTFSLTTEGIVGFALLVNQEPIDLPPGSQLKNVSATPNVTSFEVDIGKVNANTTKTVRFWVIAPLYVVQTTPASASIENTATVQSSGVEVVPENNSTTVNTVLFP